MHGGGAEGRTGQAGLEIRRENEVLSRLRMPSAAIPQGRQLVIGYWGKDSG
jgi:hypothetical protein